MAHHQVLKAMSTERAMVKVGFFVMTWRQFWIVTAPPAVLYFCLTFLPSFLRPNPFVLAAIFGPIILASIAIAYFPYQNRTLDWHLWRWWVSIQNPRVLFWRHRPPGREPGEGDLKDSVQHYLPLDDVLSPVARSKDGTRYLVFKAFRQPSVALAGEEDRDRLWARSKEVLDSLDFPVTEILDSREGHVTTYAETLRERLAGTLTMDQQNLLVFARQHLRHIDEVARAGNVYERIGYVILSHNPLSEAGGAAPKPGLFERAAGLFRTLAGRKYPTPKNAEALQEADEAALAVLTERGRLVTELYEGVGVSLRLLYGEEVTSFLRGGATDEPDSGPESPHEEIVRHDMGGYDEIPEHKRAAIHAAAGSARRGPFPAWVNGFLTPPDKIAPDCVEIEDDHLKVGDTYRTYLFVREWPEKVAFPQLAPLATMRGRIRLVKLMRPIDDDVAAQLFGRELARLLAAEEAADTGHVIEKKKRKSAARAAERGVDELVEGRQRYIELSFYVELQAPTLQELGNLRRRVETKMRGAGTKPMLARKEMWEAYCTCLGVCEDRLTARYARKGMLTEPLADMQLFVSHQINHETGVFCGTDPENDNPVTLDTRRFLNPHIIVLGVPGAGKTFFMKCLATRIRCQDEAVYIIDPRGNSGYQRVTTAMDGEYVPFGIGSDKRFNPFDMKGYLNLELLAALAGDDVEGVDDERMEAARREAKAHALDAKINKLRRLVSIMTQGEGGDGLLTSEEEGEVDDLLRLTYETKDITDDPDTHDFEPPTFATFFAVLRAEIEKAEGRQARERLLRGLQARLKLWEKGSLRSVFGGHTNFDLKNKFMTFHLGRLEGREKAAVYFALHDFLVPRLSNKDEPTNLFDDEMWDILMYPIAAKDHMEQYRTGRARNNRMVGASQDVEEFMASEHGRTILAIPETKLVLRLPGGPVETLSKYVDITGDQKEKIKRLGQGSGHLIVGENVVPLKVSASEWEERLFNTNPQKEADYRRREAARGITGGPISAMKQDAREEAPGAFDEGRRLTDFGRVRQLLASDPEDQKPRPGDYEKHEQPLANGGGESTERAPLVPARAEGGEAPLVAVVGPSAGLVAFNLAGFLAREGRPDGRKVLLVDAEGHISNALLPGPKDPPDARSADGGEIARRHLRPEGTTGLTVLPAPDRDDTDAARLILAAQGSYDLVIAACGRSTYAAQWISASDRAVAAGTDLLEETVERAERLRGRDGSLLAPIGDSELPPALAGRRAFRFPDAGDPAFREAARNDTFASITDPAIGGTTAALARELLTV
jgi:DNA polymerase III delta prime subunit